MKGLIYRELYLARKSYIGGMIVVAMFIVLGVLIRLSLVCGNLADLDAETYKMVDMASYIVFSYLPLLLLLVPLAGDGGVAISDYKSKWMLYAYTLQYSEKQMAAVKYIIKISLLLLGFGLAFCNLCLFGGLSGQGIRGTDTVIVDGIILENMQWNSVKILLIVMMLVTAVSAFATPLLLRYKSTNAVIIRICAVAIVLYFVVMGMFSASLADIVASQLPEMEVLNQLFGIVLQFRDRLAMVAPFVIVITLALGYWLTVKQLKKREVM